MYNGKTILSVIPARKGSTELPGKNWKKLKDKPLVCWSVESSLQSKYVDRTVVSTDSNNVVLAIDEYDCGIVWRAPNLACNVANTETCIIDAVAKADFYPDYVLTLHPTCPNRPNYLIDRCIEKLLIQDQHDALFTARKYPPFFAHQKSGKVTLNPMSNLSPRCRRQDIKPEDWFWLDAVTVYLTKTDSLLRCCDRMGRNPMIFSITDFEAADIDSTKDFENAERIMNHAG